ncbi:MAG: prenyltransferase/squalene oxidase repeat-containing protein [Myxococcota bacterium]
MGFRFGRDKTRAGRYQWISEALENVVHRQISDHQREHQAGAGADGRTQGLRIALLALALTACPTARTPTAATFPPVEKALTQGANWLLSQQGPDGGWHSNTYAAFRDGRALTPVVLSAVLYAAPRDARTAAAYDRGVDFVASLVDDEGTLQHRLDYPVYSLAGALLVLDIPRNARHLRQRDAIITLLRAHQLSSENGWSAEDPEAGGWGYWHEVPVKPPMATAHHELLSSNLSATLFAVGALRLSGVPSDDRSLQTAQAFLLRCRNEDGGFFLTPTNPIQNKAASDASGRPRSYASATADGVRLMLKLGLPITDPKVQAARAWLLRHVHGAGQHGDFPPEREFSREGSYFYTSWTVAHALMFLGVTHLTTPQGAQRWADVFARELMARQQPDGSFRNAATDLREDDPLVATSLALATLALARTAATGDLSTSVTMER